ncbi:MAG TPA: hypothetical protein VM911_05685 [Pyrinomonadaceae bacterium]|nr:hypothetical protein [Pyrinomonadaceae bacterium]
MTINDDEKMVWLGGTEELRPEPRGFSPEQMVRCEECLRANPPTRTVCLYCAKPLPLTEASAQLRQPLHRKLENWQPGVNLILLPDGLSGISEESAKEMAELLRLQTDELLRILEAGAPLPVARTATLDDASLIEGRLRALGANALIVSDQELALEDAAPQRLRALEFKEDALVALPVGSSEGLSIAWTEIILLVAGRLFERRVEVEERRGRGSAENEIVEARELSADEAVLDIYAKGLDGNFRIVSNNFDFSCLGAEKKLIAAENFLRLSELLRERSPLALYDDFYARVRHALNAVWPLEESTGSGGLRRARPGRVNTETVTRTGNEKQFTRYSRLKGYLRTKHS